MPVHVLRRAIRRGVKYHANIADLPKGVIYRERPITNLRPLTKGSSMYTACLYKTVSSLPDRGLSEPTKLRSAIPTDQVVARGN